MRLAAWLLLLVSFVGEALADGGRKFYVSNHGDDAADGRSEQTAWKTLARVQRQELKGGDEVLLANGSVWRESWWIGYSGEEGNPIRIIGYGDYTIDRPRISGADERGKPARDFCIEVNQSHIELNGLSLSDCKDTGRAALFVYAHRDLTNVTIRECVVENNGSRGIFVSGDPQRRVSNLRVSRNKIQCNGGSGVLVTHAEHSVFAYNNLVENCRVKHEPWQAGIRVAGPRVADVLIHNNLIARQTWGHDQTAALGIHVDETGGNITVENNAVSEVDHAGIEVENTRGVRVIGNRVRRAEVGVFVYRAGHDQTIADNVIVDCRSQGIALQGHRAGGINAGPEIEVNGELFTNCIVRNNSATGSKWGSLKCVGGAENGVTVNDNDFGPDRPSVIEWGDRTYDRLQDWIKR